MALNNGQQKAVEEALYAIFESEEHEPQGYMIVGEGGTGKTFAFAEIIREVIANGHHVLMTAPTHKAVKQIQKSFRAAGLVSDNIHYSTIHAALGLALMPSDENKYVSPVKESIIGDFALVGCDEASMLNSILISAHLKPELDATGTFFIGMGDDMQLGPVKDENPVSPIFDMFPTTELTENQRQPDNPDGSPNGVLEFARKLRVCIKANRPFKFDYVPDNNIKMVKDKDFLQTVLAGFDADTDLENTRVLAWRNFRVDDINNAIRHKIYGPDRERFELGERVVTGGQIKDMFKNVLLTPDEECIVTAQKEGTRSDPTTQEMWKTRILTLQPVYADVKQVFAVVLHESEFERFNRDLERLKQKAYKAEDRQAKGYAWKKVHDFADQFNDIKYAYCLTVHRCQGSTYDTVYLDVKDILENPKRSERQRLLYVGSSRPRSLLVINKTGFVA